ncbi:hypothetical protein GGU11DRAFT_745650 [Lentinula aff. detonsa]|nr:hypothetical protein GGU11DRAFT_745650 [Lentinula aff. detonsa]
MSSTTNETTQQCRECLLLAQAERQRAHEEEITRQEAEFAAEMEQLEEEAAREEGEKQLTKEKREEEKRIAEEKRVVEEQKKRQEEQAEAAAEVEDEQERTTAFARIVEENKREKERAAKELEKRQKRPPAAKTQQVTVVIPPRSLGLKKKLFKSKSAISNDSDVEEREVMPAPRGEKRKRPIKMIARGGNMSNADGDYDPEVEQGEDQPPTNSSSHRPACTCCEMIGQPLECCPDASILLLVTLNIHQTVQRSRGTTKSSVTVLVHLYHLLLQSS